VGDTDGRPALGLTAAASTIQFSRAAGDTRNMEVAHPGFGSGLSAAIERRHRPKPAVEANDDRIEPVPPAAPAVPAAVRPRSRTRGVVELAVGVVGALVVIDGGLRAWQRVRA
jgi:hypothetical protein